MKCCCNGIAIFTLVSLKEKEKGSDVKEKLLLITHL